RNASFKRLFHFDSINLSLLGSYSEQAKFSESASHSHLFKQHVQKLKHDTSTLSKKRDVFSKLTEDYKMYEPLIRRKLSELDSAILDKKIELEAISELMNAINCTGASETQRTSPV
ncbi:hypothetical protein, partial [Vibrio parahaemolyticus]